MAPRNLRKKRPVDSEDEEEEEPGQQSLQERIEDARTLIKNREKAKVRAAQNYKRKDNKKVFLPPSPNPKNVKPR